MEKVVKDNLNQAFDTSIIEFDKNNLDVNEFDILSQYSERQQSEIQHRRQVLSTLACFIGKDFNIPVELNSPKCGWHWDVNNNIIRIDPEDLLNESMDYLRYVISHEGGHRRISKLDFISNEEYQQPGFSFLMNAIEDPRVDNFVSEISQEFFRQKNIFYEDNLNDIEKQLEISNQPQFIQAGYEYIKLWYRESCGQEIELSDYLSSEVKEVVLSTIEMAKEAWWRYPSRMEADDSEETISKYAMKSYEIIRDKIWPKFKKLVENDLDNQLIKQYTDNLDEFENNNLDTDNLSDDERQQLTQQIDSLSPDRQQELIDNAINALNQIEQDFNDRLSSKLIDVSDDGNYQEETEDSIEASYSIIHNPMGDNQNYDVDEVDNFKRYIKKELNLDMTEYDKLRRPLIPLIDKLESDLRDIFIMRKNHGWQSNFKTGQKIDISKRIQEKAKAIPVIDSKSWKKRELSDERDYAISVVVDLSGSMSQRKKINDTFDGVIVLTEALSRLSINHEISGFNSEFYAYKDFNEQITKESRNRMTGMLREVDTDAAGHTDDGWALIQASESLVKQKTANQKIMIILSDGSPNESYVHNKPEFDLRVVIDAIEKDTDIKLIGLGVGRGTEHVNDYYRESIANIDAKDMASGLAGIIVDAIAR